MKYKHFIITRFNLKSDSPAMLKDRTGNEVLTSDWLVHRFSLFLNYCLPSVINQSCRNFLWLIYFDERTPELIRMKNSALESKYPDILKVIYADGYNDFLDRYCSDILTFCSDGISHIISTRLDNDDILHTDFVKRIQDQFAGQHFTAVNFTKILMMSPDTNNKLFIDYIFSNHFISLIEKITPEGIKGCYSRSDRQWLDIQIIQVTDAAYCIELISEKNLSNNFRGFPVLKKTDLTNFQIDQLARNKILDIRNLKVWRMSWIKYIEFLFNKIHTTKEQK